MGYGDRFPPQVVEATPGPGAASAMLGVRDYSHTRCPRLCTRPSARPSERPTSQAPSPAGSRGQLAVSERPFRAAGARPVAEEQPSQHPRRAVCRSDSSALPEAPLARSHRSASLPRRRRRTARRRTRRRCRRCWTRRGWAQGRGSWAIGRLSCGRNTLTILQLCGSRQKSEEVAFFLRSYGGVVVTTAYPSLYSSFITRLASLVASSAVS